MYGQETYDVETNSSREYDLNLKETSDEEIDRTL